MAIDTDEKIDGMCNKCKGEIKKNTCTRCGTVVEEERTSYKNRTFDESKFNTLAGKLVN